MKLRKAVLGILAAASVLANGFTVSAGEGCPNGAHSPKVLYDRQRQYQEKTGEHEISVENGKQAVCYIYTEYYQLTYYCQKCGAFTYEMQTVRDVHSLSH